jgi:threonine dehydratase
VIGLADVEAAREAIGDRLHRTPMFTSGTLSERVGARVTLKAELFQKTGSFKPRGVLTNLAALDDAERERGVIGISAGNHAQALAWGAAEEGIDALLVMWRGASESKIEATRGYGAEVDLESPGPTEAFDRLAELVERTGRTLVHPFDHPLTIAGQGTVGLEVVEDVPDADVVLVPVGGGGLISGVATAVKARAPNARVIGVEPELSPALYEALAAGKPVPVEPRSIADGLGAPFAGAHGLEICRERVDRVVLVREEEIEQGMRFLYTRAKLACEPAAGAPVGALLAGKVPLEAGETVVAVVSGGNVAAETAVAILGGR